MTMQIGKIRESRLRKVEIAEDDFKMLVDIVLSMEVTLQSLILKFNQVSSRHTVTSCKGQVVSLEAKKKG